MTKEPVAIPETWLRASIIEKLERLEAQIEKLKRKLEEDRLRQLLKEEYVPREVFESRLEGLSTKIEAFEKIEKAYERLSSRQEKVLEQQLTFLKWIEYSTILLPIAVVSVPVIEIVSILVRHYLGIL